jgi:hypothetical protein
MGLDSRIYFIPRELAMGQGQCSGVELQNWRGHEELNDWMMRLCLQKGKDEKITEEDIARFCGVSIDLSMGDIETLEAMIRAGSLPEFQGDLVSFARAKAEIRNGNYVFYSADW